MATEDVWKFDQGIVSFKSIPHTPLVKRYYYVRYAKGELRRLFSVIMSFATEGYTEDLLRWASDKSIRPEILAKAPKFLNTFSRVVTIMDFNITEKDQQPKRLEELEKDFRFMRADIDSDEDPISLKYFEKMLPNCSFEKCVCTLTNDEESLKRIREVCPGDIPVQSPSDSASPAPSP